MIQVLKKIFLFLGTRQALLKKSIVISFISAVFTAMQFGALMVALDCVINNNHDMKNIWKLLLIMIISIVGRIVCTYFSLKDQTATGYFMVSDKRIHIGDLLRYIPMGFFNENSLGNITAVVTTTLGDVENSASRCLVMLLGGFLNTIVLALAMFFVDWRIGLISVVGIGVYLIVTEFAQRYIVKSGTERQRAQESLVESVLEYIQGMSVVKAYNLQKNRNQSVQKKIDDSCKKALNIEYHVVPWSAARRIIINIFSVIIMLAAIKLYMQESIDIVYCILTLVASFMIYKELESAGNMSDLLQMLGASIDKANSIDSTPTMDIEGKDLRAQDSSVEFKNVSFSYGDKKILDNVSLSIPPKTTTAIVGPSGGGKTTMCNLIARFWDVDNGEILVGNHNVKDYKLDNLMKNISMVFQNVYLFQDTIENNIKFGKNDATHEEVVEAAKKACCHDFIMELPDGYNTIIGEGGGTLSGGQKQRISIARAMLKDAPIIILDEATANVDPENEKELQSAIDALTHDKTIIMIAHRLKTVENADQILVLSNGHIVQKGTHEELLIQDGIYSDFINARKNALGWTI